LLGKVDAKRIVENGTMPHVRNMRLRLIKEFMDVHVVIPRPSVLVGADFSMLQRLHFSLRFSSENTWLRVDFRLLS
jgi:hypothetical protein